MIKVSIIVPVYNAGKYLIQCLDSLIGQTLEDIEIILVLDTPTDGSDKICEEYSKNDNRIKVIRNTSNLHIGFSRNEGIKVARGEYIGFADHDDYCDLQMFEQLYNNAKQKNADVVVSNIFNESGNIQDYYSFPDEFSDRIFNEKMLTALISGNRSIRNTYSFDNASAIWNQLYRNSFIKENDILFCDNRKATIEDVTFNIKAHFFAKTVCFVPETLYHHVNHEQNTFGSYDYFAISKIIPHLKEIFYFLKENNAWHQYKEIFAVCALKRLYTSYRNEINFKGFIRSFYMFKLIRNNPEMQEILSIFHNNIKIIKNIAITKMIFLYAIKKNN